MSWRYTDQNFIYYNHYNDQSTSGLHILSRNFTDSAKLTIIQFVWRIIDFLLYLVLTQKAFYSPQSLPVIIWLLSFTEIHSILHLVRYLPCAHSKALNSPRNFSVATFSSSLVALHTLQSLRSGIPRTFAQTYMLFPLLISCGILWGCVTSNKKKKVPLKWSRDERFDCQVIFSDLT